MTVKIYCELCEESQPVLIDRMQKDDLNGDKIWGDLVCSVCKLVITSLETDEPGVYEFVRTGP